MNGISLNDIMSGRLSGEAAEAILSVAMSDLTDEQKERAFQAVERSAGVSVTGCSVTMQDASPRLTLWQWLGLSK